MLATLQQRKEVRIGDSTLKLIDLLTVGGESRVPFLIKCSMQLRAVCLGKVTKYGKVFALVCSGTPANQEHESTCHQLGREAL